MAHQHNIGRVRNRVWIRVRVRYTFHRVDIPANIVLQTSR